MKLILSYVVTESDIYNNYRYASFVDWEIEKTTEANPMKIKFNIDKPKTDMKKIDFNININVNGNGNEINHMNNKEAIHPSGELTDDDFSNIVDHKTQHERINQNNIFILLLKTNYNRALRWKI